MEEKRAARAKRYYENHREEILAKKKKCDKAKRKWNPHRLITNGGFEYNKWLMAEYNRTGVVPKKVLKDPEKIKWYAEHGFDSIPEKSYEEFHHMGPDELDEFKDEDGKLDGFQIVEAGW